MLLLTFLIGFTIICNAQTTEIKIEAKGVFKEIDVTHHNEAIEILKGENQKSKKKMIDIILNNSNDYNPPVIYALSKELYNQDKKDEAMYWFYVAQLRARYDANLCMDNSAKQGVSILNNEYGSEINEYAFKDLDKLEKTVTSVTAFVRSNEENYDHRWLNLHGMWAIMAGLEEQSETKELSQPKDKWVEIKKKTIDDYYNGFIEYVKSQKKSENEAGGPPVKQQLIGFWKMIELPNKELNKVNPWPLPYQWFGFYENGKIYSIMEEKDSNYSSNDLDKIFRDLPKEKAQNFNLTDQFLTINNLENKNHQELWGVNIFAADIEGLAKKGDLIMTLDDGKGEVKYYRLLRKIN